MVHLHFCSLSLLFVQFPWLLIPVHCCWFNPVLLVSFHPLFVLFNLPWLCSPAFLSCWNSSISLVSVGSTPNLIHFIPIFATEILLFATKPGRKHCPKWTLSSPWQICMRRPHWHSKNKTFAIKSGDIHVYKSCSFKYLALQPFSMEARCSAYGVSKCTATSHLLGVWFWSRLIQCVYIYI